MAEVTRPKAVVFDLDGTLIDTMMLAPTAYAETIRSLGGPVVTAEDVVAAWHRGPTPVVLEHFLKRPISSDDMKRFYQHFQDAVDSVKVFPGVPAMVAALHEQGYRLAVFTSATKRGASLMLAATGLDEHLTTLVGGDDAIEPKPSPAGLKIACRWIGITQRDAAYVGDSPVDLQCAEAAGAFGIHAAWAESTVPVEGDHPVAEDPADVARILEDLTHR